MSNTWQVRDAKAPFSEMLDTNLVSELRRPRLNPAVVAWVESESEADLHLCAVTIGEIQAGIELTREQDAAKAAEVDR